MPDLFENKSPSNNFTMSFSSDDEESSKLSSSNQNVSLSELKALDNLLRCPSCYDYIRTAMILPNCHHNFCSLCIRKYFCYKTQCPACSAQASGPELRNNRILDNVIEQYKKIKKPLKKFWREKEKRDSPKEENKSTVVAAVNSSLNNHISKNVLLADGDSEIEIWEENAKKVATKFTDYDSDSDFHQETLRKAPKESFNGAKENFDKVFPSSTDNKKPKRTEKTGANVFTKLKEESMFTSSPDSCLPSCSTPVSSQDSSQTSSNADRVDCPVCGVSVRQQSINKHLDNCLNKTEKIESLRSSNKKKPITKLVYHLMSDKDIRNRLKDLGLSTEGDRKVLIKRHQEFSLLHNSDCDSLHPLSTPELVRHFEKNERLQKKLSDSSKQKGLKISKNADQAEIRQAQKTYEKQHKNQFKALIEQARIKAKADGGGDRARKTTEASKDSDDEALETKTDSTQTSENLAQIIRQTVDDISQLVSNSSQESFDLFPGSDFKKPVEESPAPNGEAGTVSLCNNLDDTSDLDEVSDVRTPCRKSLFTSKSVNGDASPIPQSPVIGDNMFLSPRRSKLSSVGGTLYVDDSGSEMGDVTTPSKDKSCIENSVNTTGSSELWPALSLHIGHHGDNGDINGNCSNINGNGDIHGDSDDIHGDSDGDASDIIPVCELEPPSIDSIIRPTRLSLQLRQSGSIRKSKRQKRKAESDGEDTRPSKKLKY